MLNDMNRMFYKLINITIFLFVAMANTHGVAESVIHRGNRGEPDTLDPHKTVNGWEASIAMELFTGLTAFGPAGQILPAMAKEWSVSDDGLTYTWHLRDGLKWSDGEAFTAADFVYSFRRLFDPVTASSFASLLYPIKGSRAVNTGATSPMNLAVTAHDDLTLVMELEHPTPYLPQILIHRGLPVPRHVVEKIGQRWSHPRTFVGNGAFTLAEWVPQTHVRLNANPLFFEAPAVALDALYFHPTENLSTAIDRFRAGEIDIVPSVPHDRLVWIKDNMPTSLRVNPSLGVEYLAFNVKRTPFGDSNIRRALSMAIDRDILVGRFLKGGEVGAYSIVHPGVMGGLGPYRPEFLAPESEVRLSQALALLNQAGYSESNPLSIELRFNNQDIVSATMEVVSRMWSRLPVKIDLLKSDTPTLYADTRSGNFDIARAAWYPEAVDPSTYLFLLKSTSGPMNQSGYADGDFDALLDRADREVDPNKRLIFYRHAEEHIGEEQPIMPLFYYAFRMLVATKVQGWQDHNRNTHPGRYLSIKRN
ncbi:MAG: peptide ABC transporter substrate-binding protein [Rhodospirillaceae bacterium]